MPMKMLPNTSGAWPRTGGVGGASVGPEPLAMVVWVCTRAACQTAMTSASAPALVAHHPLDHALACLSNLALFAQSVGAIRADLAGLAPDLDADQLVRFFLALAAH